NRLTNAIRLVWLSGVPERLAGPVAGFPHPSSPPNARVTRWRLRGGWGCPSRRHPLDRRRGFATSGVAERLAGPVAGFPHPSSPPSARVTRWRLRGGWGRPSRRHPLDRRPGFATVGRASVCRWLAVFRITHHKSHVTHGCRQAPLFASRWLPGVPEG